MQPERLWTRNFILGTAINFLLMVNYYSLMVVIADYSMKTYFAPASTAGLAASVFIIGALIARLISGRVMDKIGRKRLLFLGVIGEVVFSVLYVLNLGFAPLFAIRLFHGLAYGMCSTTIGTVVTSIVPSSRKGEGVGYYMLSVTLGAAVGPFLGMFLTQNAGFHLLFIVAAAVAGLCLLSTLLLKTPDAAHSETKTLPTTEDEGRKTIIDQTAAPKKHVGRPRLSNYLESAVIPLSAVCAILFFCYSSLLAFLTPFAAERGLETPASIFFIVYAIATFATRPFTGKLFDRKGDRAVMIPAFIAFICGMALLASVHQAPAMLAAAALLGFGVGTIQSSGLALAVRIVPDNRLSLANSTFYIFLDVGVGIGPFILGIAQPLWGYAGLFSVMAGVACVSFALYLVVSRKQGSLRKRLDPRK